MSNADTAALEAATEAAGREQPVAGRVRLTTAQAIVRYLSAQWSVRDGRRERLIPAMLGIFGHGNVAGLGQALDEQRAELPFIQGRNEQSLVHLAVGYAKAKRRTSALAVTASIGPGSTNLVTGAALATVNRLPVLLLPSDTYASRRQGPVLQQLEHPLERNASVNDCLRPVARMFDRIVRPEQLLTALPEAMRVLTSPDEAGAAIICLPQDVQSEAHSFPVAFFASRDWEIKRRVPHPAEVAEVAELIKTARCPLIIAGGGVLYSEAEAELAALAEMLGIPVVETFAGKGAVQRDTWWGLGGVGLEGNPAANALARDADLIVSVGTRLTDFATGSQSIFANPDVRFASINVVDHDARKQGATPILADARLALAALREACGAVAPQAAWTERARAEKQRWVAQRAEALRDGGEAPMTQGHLIGLMNAAAGPGDTVIAAAGSPPGDLLKVWDATEGRSCHLEFGFSCMGYELPAALGVRLAQPDGQVTAFIGDGTFLMQPSELATALQEGLKVTVVISDNHGFQVIRRLQMQVSGQHYGNEMRYRSGALGEATLDGDYVQLDLAGVAAGLGATVFTAQTTLEVQEALRRAASAAGPVVIVVPTAPHASLPAGGVWWDVAPAQVSDQTWVSERRRQYELGLQQQRWHG